MAAISNEVGRRIRTYRKQRRMTLEQLAGQINKSKATVSKYEKGEIILDIETLYEIAEVLRVRLDQLLFKPQEEVLPTSGATTPAFFDNLPRFYAYVYDGRANRIIRCVFDVLAAEGESRYKVKMHMNFDHYETYENSENTYWGTIEHFDALTRIVLQNKDTPIEQVNINILASFLDSETKWGLFCGVSSRPMMPVAVKMLFSRKILEENDRLERELKVSREDIRLFKHYNMFSVT